jgi:hypothetical protein
MVGMRHMLVGIGLLAGTASASAQVAYQPYGSTTVTPYGYPVVSGFLQPNEEGGTSPSFVIMPGAYGSTVGVVQRCQYPDGWNVTDFDRDVNGIPDGIDHTCPAPSFARSSLRARY